jgi:hypothetical protein
MLHRKIKDDFYNMIIFDDDVLDIVSQPETFKFETDKNIISYTPNFLVKYHDRTECIEIRTFYETQRADFKEKVNLIKNHFRKVGIEFTVVTENVIRERPSCTDETTPAADINIVTAFVFSLCQVR